MVMLCFFACIIIIVLINILEVCMKISYALRDIEHKLKSTNNHVSNESETPKNNPEGGHTNES